MFNLQKDTYVILNYNGKNKLALVSSFTKSTVNAFLNEELERDDTVTPIKVPIEMILADLGSQPKFGAVHGVKVEPFYAGDTHEFWGDINFYRLLKGKEKKWLYQGLDRTAELLDKRGLTSFVPVTLKIHEHSGKYLGYYKHSKKEGIPSTMGLSAPTYEIEPEDLDYIIYHESAHGIWSQSVPSELRAQWVKLFEKRIKCKKIKQKDLDFLLEAISRYDGGIKDFIKNEAADEEQEIIKSCLQHMNKIYRLSVPDIETLLREDNIDDYWPTQQEISRIMPDVSEYACKNTDETFAEVMAHYLLKHSLPKDVKSLMKETIQFVRR